MVIPKFTFARIALCTILLTSSTLHAGFITDTTIGTATRDGVINAGEYVGGFAGVNNGFGNVIGSQSTLYIDSSLSGQLNFGFQRGLGTFPNNNVIVIYIDSKSGGFNSTANFTDTDDGGRRAISGYDVNQGRSTLTFANGFNADYAIAIQPSFAGLFELIEGGSHNFVAPVSGDGFNNDGNRATEVQMTLSNLGMAQGGTLKYIATYISDTAFRSNEFNGVSSSSFGGGWNPVTLNDFHSFQSVPEPTSLSLLGLTALAAMTGYRRRVR
jgi:hypothetical protein